MKTFNPLDYPISLTYPSRVASSAWTEHVPFAMTLIDMVRPRVFVELGAFCGVSYCAFCQAITQLRLNTRAYAVDTWKGDPHNGSNGPAILEELRAFHDPLYGGFSRLVPSTFDDALPHFGDGTIDLLHIDGYHVYDSVAHDFETWLPKMSDRGVVILHDINVREYNFGVWKLWAEVKDRYPSFDLLHQHGLGLVVVGKEVPDGLRPLLDTTGAERVAVREYFFHLGQRITSRWDKAALEKRLAEAAGRDEGQLAEQCARQEAHLAEQHALIEQLREAHTRHLAEEQANLAVLRGKLAETEQLLRVRDAQLQEKNALLEEVQPEVVALRARLRDREEQVGVLSLAMHGWEGRIQALQAEAGRARAGEQYWQAAVGHVQASLAWRLAQGLSRGAHALAPRGSRRRRVLGTVRRAARVLRRQGPVSFLHKVTGKLGGLFWRPQVSH